MPVSRPVNVRGTEAIVRLAAQAGAIPIHYIYHWQSRQVLATRRASHAAGRRTPLDHGGILHSGYTQSKWVAKLIMAAQERGLPATIYRPSLIIRRQSKAAHGFGDNIVATCSAVGSL
ncbi:MAG: SDR family oxidoreductase [Caldilineaceae bacterium]